MPARIVIVHDEKEFLEPIAAAFRLAGYDIAIFTNPMVALDAFETAKSIELLITRVGFPAGVQNGISLARMIRMKRPGVKILFVALPEYEDETRGLGEFLPSTSNIGQLLEVASRLLRSP